MTTTMKLVFDKWDHKTTNKNKSVGKGKSCLHCLQKILPLTAMNDVKFAVEGESI